MQSCIADAIEKHRTWIARIEQALADRQLTADLEHAGYDDMCDFGKWLYALDDAVKVAQPYRRIKDAHYRFHQEAEAVVRSMRKGEFGDARQMLRGDFARTSEELIAALRDWQLPV